MKTAKEEYLGILCKFYLVVLLAILPLYMQDGYYMLGDAKYLLFRNCSFLCLGIWLVLEAGTWLVCLYGKIKNGETFQKPRGKESGTGPGSVDIFVFIYGICVLLSAIGSPYAAAWNGYVDWYMGATSQLLFVGIYFMVSRYYSYDRLPLYMGEMAFFAVIMIGLLNRLEFDPMGTLRVLTETDWEYSHMLSTIGNINWFCGYCSVLLALPISGYLYSHRKGKTAILYVVSVLGLMLLFIQGSDSGMVLAAVAIGCCLMAGRKRPEFFQKGLLLFAGTSVSIWLMGQLIEFFEAWEATPVDGWIYGKMLWNGWFVLAAIGGLFCLGYRWICDKFGEKLVRRLIMTFLAVLILTIATLLVLVVLQWSGATYDSWGSGRGVLWKLAWEGFQQADIGGKLVGAGPDCYAEYLTSIGKPPIITDEDHWANAIFANAHNEWLNHLVNIGILGVGCYAGIFIAALRRYRGMMLAVLMLAMYGIHSLVSFQQVLNAPLLFAVLGICENQYRRVEERYI